MIEFFKMIGTAIATGFNLILSFVSGIVQFFTLIGEFIAYVTEAVAFLPAPLIAFCMMGVTVSVLLMVIGRN